MARDRVVLGDGLRDVRAHVPVHLLRLPAGLASALVCGTD